MIRDSNEVSIRTPRSFFGKSSKVKTKGLGKLLNSYTWIQGIPGGYILTIHLGWPDVAQEGIISVGKTNMKVVASGWKIANQIGQEKKSVTQSRAFAGRNFHSKPNPKTQSWATFWWLYIWNPTSRGWLMCVKVCNYMYKLGIISIIHLKNKLPCIKLFSGFYTSKICFALKVVTACVIFSVGIQRHICQRLLGSATLTDTWRSALPENGETIDVVSGWKILEIRGGHRNWGSFTKFYRFRVSKNAKLKSLTLRNWEWEHGT